MQTAPLPVSSVPDIARQGVRYVGFWARVAASLIDTVLMALVLAPLTAFMFGTADPQGVEDAIGDPAHFVLNTVVPAMAVLLFWARTQSTPGKMLLKARIVDEKTGEAPRPGQLVVRYLGYYLSAIVVGLGFVWIAFDARKQGWHDKLAGTVVVRPGAETTARDDESLVHAERSSPRDSPRRV